MPQKVFESVKSKWCYQIIEITFRSFLPQLNAASDSLTGMPFLFSWTADICRPVRLAEEQEKKNKQKKNEQIKKNVRVGIEPRTTAWQAGVLPQSPALAHTNVV